MDNSTYSYTVPDANGDKWLRLTLDGVYCITHVIWFFSTYGYHRTYDCAEIDTEGRCSCEGMECKFHFLTVSITGTQPDNLPAKTDCQYGDTVEIEKSNIVGSYIAIYEIAVVGYGTHLFPQF